MRTHRRLNVIRTSIVGVAIVAVSVGAQTPRPMTFLDAQNMRQTATPDLSSDGKLMLYTLSIPDWNQARRQSDIYMVSTERGLASARQLTFTKDKNETNPRWSHDGTFIAFLSDRDAPAATGGAAAAGGRGGAGGGGVRNQLFVMRLDGGEAKRVTDTREGVSNFSFTKDGKSIAYTSGRAGDEQIYMLPVTDLWTGDAPRAAQLTRHATGVGNWQ